MSWRWVDQKPAAEAILGQVREGKIGIETRSDDAFRLTLLMLAASHDLRDDVELLLDAGVDVNARNARGNAALLYAADAGTLPVLRSLVEAGADVHAANRYGQTSLLYATEWQNAPLVRYMLQQGADAHAVYPAQDGAPPRSAFATALEAAADAEGAEILQLFIAAGTQFDIYHVEYSHRDLRLSSYVP